jgi:hypothetical protein
MLPVKLNAYMDINIYRTRSRRRRKKKAKCIGEGMIYWHKLCSFFFFSWKKNWITIFLYVSPLPGWRYAYPIFVQQVWCWKKSPWVLIWTSFHAHQNQPERHLTNTSKLNNKELIHLNPQAKILVASSFLFVGDFIYILITLGFWFFFIATFFF